MGNRKEETNRKKDELEILEEEFLNLVQRRRELEASGGYASFMYDQSVAANNSEFRSHHYPFPMESQLNPSNIMPRYSQESEMNEQERITSKQSISHYQQNINISKKSSVSESFKGSLRKGKGKNEHSEESIPAGSLNQNL